MARKVKVTFRCDPCRQEQGKEVEARASGPISFTYGSGAYELDVCESCGKEVEETLGTLAAMAQKVSAATRNHAARSMRQVQDQDRVPARRDRLQTAAIRAWVQEKYPGKVSDRGRIPRRFEAEWEQEHSAVA